MSQVVAARHAAACLAALALVAHPAAAPAQTDPLDEANAPLDPSAPLDPWPDLQVDWPDMEGEADGLIPDIPDTAVADAAAARGYAYRIEGLDAVEAAALLEQFRDLSTLEAFRGDPANAAQIDRRARADGELLAELLRAYGYYDALVTTRVDATPGGGFDVVLDVEPGPVYRFAQVRLPGIEQAAAGDAAALREAFTVVEQDPVDAARVEAAQAALEVELGRRGYAFAEIGEPEVVVDHETRTATLVMPVRTQGTRRFGRVVVEGRPLFSAEHVETIARFEEGDPYRTGMVEDLRQALVATGLISTVTIRPVARPDSDLVDLAVAIDPAPMRTIAGEAGYGTGEGLRVEASWQHRNLLPPEGAVTFRGVLGTREQLVSAILRRNNFERRDQVLNAQIAIAHVDRPAFNADTFVLAGGIERQSNIIWQKAWTWSVGAELTATDERDVDVESGMTRRRTFFIGAIPVYLGYDGSNDLLDPTSGFRLSARFSPEASLQSGSFFYARGQIDGSFYQPVSDTVTLAGRTRLGTIFGASRDRIAPSRRFYAGGGGSVRGYGFQALGPRDPVFDDPIGGRSLAEFALEARVRVGNFGIVPFVDGGNISTSPWPRFDNLRFGAGVGVRYHTRFGPIRVDVATPLNPQSGDPRIAVYVSLGQAF
ncbi:autotransporter assembly complex family protein [Sphingosinicella sp. CPCC 101087]|uniref:autotransporter assembly complex protein TamA n=1 Tax=Sphingosinicella sp. CPCC 101087 TaxID=2497754 RepID=UPI00101C64B5|nr:BamA/TamA family outer membrane protein [Sphingosinicella sp. CPCC 101087]